jgi:hypothetical protein
MFINVPGWIMTGHVELVYPWEKQLSMMIFEAELLRAVADKLDCPMPPFVPAG